MVSGERCVSRGQLYKKIIGILEKSGMDRFDAYCIFESAFGDVFPRIMMDRTLDVPAEISDKILAMTEKRCQGYPLQYIIGSWEFLGYEFKVGEGVLIPRPDTETLVIQVRDICLSRGLKAPRIADLCSGSGCIAISLKLWFPGAEVYAVELSDKALSYLRENTRLNNGADIHIVQADVLDEKTARSISDLDIIVSNPPYLTAEEMNDLQTEVSFEPEAALFGGADGLDFYREITRIWRASLKEGGFLAYEFGLGQHEDVSRILRENGFSNIQLSRDTAGIIRTAAAQKFTEDIHNG